MYQTYSVAKLIARRIAVVLGFIALVPILPFIKQPAKYSSVLFKMWLKTSDKPVWIAESEQVGRPFI
ncbi:YbfA family protein [Motilimonas cestriensis]|uniref:YbfA family protein n=1 Tax=Motilimonas cestriensis TaxID=2742685 RepID=A0ABS8WBE2_9GAMM|nr:DUF2517 family protein [Motilimonas cestriensis]MCE2595422.1 YbfA family protein [Motilimonas cestriensis]